MRHLLCCLFWACCTALSCHCCGDNRVLPPVFLLPLQRVSTAEAPLLARAVGFAGGAFALLHASAWLCVVCS